MSYKRRPSNAKLKRDTAFLKQDAYVKPEKSEAKSSARQASLNEIVQGYLSSNDRSAQMMAVQRLETDDRSAALAIAGDLRLDYALRKPMNRSSRRSMLEKADISWRRSIEVGRSFAVSIGRACLQQAFMDTYNSYVIDRTKPEPTAFEPILSIVPDLGYRLFTIACGNTQREQSKKAAIGAAGELAIIGLMTRSFKQSGSTEQFAVPSLISQDKGTRLSSPDQLRDSWDVTGLSQYYSDQLPAITYKVQVKVGDIPEARGYEDDISVVNVSTDLPGLSASGTKTSVFTICSEFRAEAAGNEQAARILDARGDQLFELLDATG
ncbi:hypothetical protein KA047_02875 [Candidatus Saccharibacteria bacterium]|nr:hypothetical protein [Candidatus Saccharibacteria bacterium]